MSCKKLYESEVLETIEKIKLNKKLNDIEVKRLDDFFSVSENHIFLNTILSSNICFDFKLLSKTILSTFKNNFTCFKNICKKGAYPTIHAGYRFNKKSIIEYNSIIIDGKIHPFLWMDKRNIDSLISSCNNMNFKLNLYYSIDGIVNVNELRKLKSYSNLTLVGEPKNPFVDLTSFSKNIISDSNFGDLLKKSV